MRKKEIIGGILVISFVCGLSGYLLAQVNKKTEPKIKEIKKKEEEKINKEIFPEGVKFEEKEINGIKFVAVLDSNGLEIGKIFEVKTLGYGGFILLKVGLENDLKIRKIKIKEHSETPGLGSKITQESFLNQFIGKTKEDLYLKKDRVEGKIDAITGATISSRAVVDGVRKLLEKVEGEKK